MEGSSYGIREQTIRLPYPYKNSTAFVKNQLIRFINSSKQKEVEIFVTANVVLSDLDKKTYR